ncbi:MAG: pyridoxamine 5'-phosphate oxidase family protein [Actinomycetota bacterium]
MPAITPEVRELVQRTRLGFVATVNADGSPNVSPKVTVRVWDDDHLIFADLESPGTMRNLRRDPRVEVNVVDPILRKGFRFRGRARVVTTGPEHERAVGFYVMGPEERCTSPSTRGSHWQATASATRSSSARSWSLRSPSSPS